jgi:hypothetical protein
VTEELGTEQLVDFMQPMLLPAKKVCFEDHSDVNLNQPLQQHIWLFV